MKEYLFNVMARLFAVLGCSTLVTACYGVSYEHFLARTEGGSVGLTLDKMENID